MRSVCNNRVSICGSKSPCIFKNKFCSLTHWLILYKFKLVILQICSFLFIFLFSDEPRKYIPAVVVGVVGMGHVPGIEKNWNSDLKIQEIMR